MPKRPQFINKCSVQLESKEEKRSSESLLVWHRNDLLVIFFSTNARYLLIEMENCVAVVRKAHFSATIHYSLECRVVFYTASVKTKEVLSTFPWIWDYYHEKMEVKFNELIQKRIQLSNLNNDGIIFSYSHRDIYWQL